MTAHPPSRTRESTFTVTTAHCCKYTPRTIVYPKSYQTANIVLSTTRILLPFTYRPPRCTLSPTNNVARPHSTISLTTLTSCHPYILWRGEVISTAATAPCTPSLGSTVSAKRYPAAWRPPPPPRVLAQALDVLRQGKQAVNKIAPATNTMLLTTVANMMILIQLSGYFMSS